MMNFTTPALMFPALSLILLAYTNRFLALSGIIRSLYAAYNNRPDRTLVSQIANLRYRIQLIRNMQIAGVASMVFCIISILLLFVDWQRSGVAMFAIALMLMLVSMLISIQELRHSGKALEILLNGLDEK